jgi:succinate dehydrogenase/fumarate reductase flavoprotein subunit
VPRSLSPAADTVTDVLVLGGGPAAAWSAVSARESGASVVMADKGWCGTSGVAAAAGIGHWFLPPDPAVRARAIGDKWAQGGYLSDRRLMAEVIDETWHRLPALVDWRYPFARSADGRPVIATTSGPEYLRTLRRQVKRSGVRLFDHSPALELLVDDDGAVVGAAGVHRVTGERWSVRAGAVVLATGGCTWKSNSLGSNVVTGDGALMAVEVGAQLSGMEFSNYYGIVPAGASMDKNGFYGMASFSHADGTPVEGIYFQSTVQLAHEAMRSGGRLYAVIDRVPAERLATVRQAMVNWNVAFEKLGVDPFTQRFPIDFILEGTVRGTGGLVVDRNGWTGVPGLYAAGDVAARDALVGGTSGAGSPNAAWTVASGTWAGRAASRWATTGAAAGAARPAGTTGLRPAGTPGRPDQWRELLQAVQAEILPVERNAVRSATGLHRSLAVLDSAWATARAELRGLGREVRHGRETAAMIAMARWAGRSALARTESRGMHYRSDHPATDPAQRHRLRSGGLDQVWTAVQPLGDDSIGWAELAAPGRLGQLVPAEVAS